MNIAGYTSLEKLHQGKHFTIARALKEKPGGPLPVVLKALDKEKSRTTNVLDSLQKEYHIIRQIDSPNVVKALEWFDGKEFCGFEMEDCGGAALLKHIGENGIPPDEFMKQAIAIVSGLSAIHRNNVIHKDINPSNIVWNPSTGALRIIDFNIAGKYDIKATYTGNPEELPGTLAYISPEQTGRMNRLVDNRTDLYSLGATFYQVLTGQPPFPHSNPVELLYDHLARSPEPPVHVNDRVPAILSKIVMKLLAKDPDERYQTVAGLKHDLEKAHKNGFRNFKLGRNDFTGRLQIPGKLYGRENEIKTLLDAYRATGKGIKEIVLLAGYSGTGKTALVNEIHRPVVEDRGLFISGKFGQLHRNIPYSAFIQALSQFCQHLLSQPRDVLNRWKAAILDSVGASGKVLTDLIPQLEQVIGPQPGVPWIGGKESRERFKFVFLRFLKVIATQDHPLVIFIDDLQWADPASLDLLQVLAEDKQSKHLFFIGAYRENEVSGDHSLAMVLEEIRQLDITVRTIPVRNLSGDDVRNMLTDTLVKTGPGTNSREVDELVRLVYSKTQGNAFFTVRFLENLCEEKLLQFDYKKSSWVWDIDAINRQKITDNVVDLLVRKIRTLPGGPREVLQLAACIGLQFDLATLTVVSGKLREELETNLETAFRENLVYPLAKKRYRFVHDRIHQAVYSIIPEPRKIRFHLEIGRLLFDGYRRSRKASGGTGEAFNFNIPNHLNMAIQLIDDRDELLELARLNLEAGRNARMSAAYKAGGAYIDTAVSLLPDRSWESHYHLSLRIFNEAIQAAYLCNQYDRMETFSETVFHSARDTGDKTVAYEYRVKSLMAQDEPLKAVDTVLELFRRLGIHVNRKPGKFRIKWESFKTTAMLKRKGMDTLKRLPVMTDPTRRLVIRLLYVGGAAFAFAAQELTPFLASTLLRVILKDGLTPESPYVISVHGGKRALLGDIPGSYHLGEIAMELLDGKIESEAVRVRAGSIVCFYTYGNKQHFKKNCQLMSDLYRYALNVGDIEYAGYIIVNYICALSRTDTEIPAVHKKILAVQETVADLKQRLLTIPLSIEQEAAQSLMGKTADPAKLDFDIESNLKNLPETVKCIFGFQAHLKQIVLAVLFESYDSILPVIEEAEAMWSQLNTPATYYKSDFNFFIPLALLDMYSRKTPGTAGKKLLGRAKTAIKLMKNWSRFGPVNFLHKYYLLQAELNRVTGKTGQVAEFYEKALEKAYENGYLNEAALICQKAAAFYVRENKNKLASLYFIEARDCFRKWGAAAKVRQLEEDYPRYLSSGFQFSPTATIVDDMPYMPAGTVSTGAYLDVKSILEASQTLSGEVQLKPLLERLVQILIQNAGAEKILLMVNDNGRFLVQAEGYADGVPRVLQAQPVEESGSVPLSLINYVARSKQKRVFDNLSNDTDFVTDRYVREREPRSAVCFPMLRKGELSAIIYMENNLVEGAFTPARLEILNMLSSQIVISMENSLLYENLEDKVRQRTVELRKAHRQLEKNHKALEESHTRINDSVNYASRIQKAVLPDDRTLKRILPEYFVLYSPCSVVSGDFYWIKQVDRWIVAAAADCTGHGVPGALVSMLGIALLNEIVPKLAAAPDFNAARILDQLRYDIKDAMKQQGQTAEQKEGMDIALCLIDRERCQIQYAGAYNSLYIVSGDTLEEVEADKMPIGIYRKERSFTNHTVHYRPGSMIYLFSDGYIHQDNEETGKAFSKRRFKKILTDIGSQPANQQLDQLDSRLREWRGNLPQRDDILILGIRL